jgi:hypothetical protein
MHLFELIAVENSYLAHVNRLVIDIKNYYGLITKLGFQAQLGPNRGLHGVPTDH